MNNQLLELLVAALTKFPSFPVFVFFFHNSGDFWYNQNQRSQMINVLQNS